MTDDDLREEVRRLRAEVDALQRRLEDLESRPPTGDGPPAGGDRPTATEQGGPPEAAATPIPATRRVADDDQRAPSATVGQPPDPAATGDGSPSAGAESTSASRDWELDVGVRWLGLVGALALVVGVVFFVRLAIERGLLDPLGRVAVGAVGGLLLYAAGRFAAERPAYRTWGRIAAGAGFAVAYFSLYAAYGFESYREAIGTPLWATLLALTVLVGAVAVESVRDGAPLVAGEAFLLGYVTAYLSTEAATLVATPTYALLLAGALVGVAAVRPWRRLVLAGVAPTYGVIALWAAQLDPAAAGTLAVAAAAFLVYLVGSYVLRRTDRLEGRWDRATVAAITLANAGLGALFVERALVDGLLARTYEGLGVAAVAAVLVGFYWLTDREPVAVPDWPPIRRDDAAAVAAVVLFGVAAAVAFEPFATTVALFAVVVAAVAVAHVDGAPAFRLGAHAVAAAAALKLVVVDAEELSAFDPAAPLAALTGRPAAFAVGVGVCYALAWWFERRGAVLLARERGRRVSVGGAYAVAATGLAVLALGLELSGVGVSAAWALFGFALIGVGFGVDAVGVRLLGIGVLAVATAKVFLYDALDLDPLERTLAFLVLGAVLLVASYAYARSRDDVDLPLAVPGRRGGE